VNLTHGPDELQDLYVNLRDQIGDLAGPGGLRRVLDIRRGRPPRGDDAYFAHMTWTVFKAGINGAVVDHKWANFRRAFAEFSVPVVAAFRRPDVRRLVNDKGIIRYRAKIEATIANARAMTDLQRQFRSFRRYLNGFEPHEQGALYVDLRRRFTHLGPYGARTFLRRVGHDVFFCYTDTLRVLYRLGLVGSPRATDEEVGRAHARIVAANPSSRLDEVNRLLTRHGSGYDLREATCGDIPQCHRCRLSHWCWYYHEVRLTRTP
jgi:3-methyladenine DNA glycosylase Tag